VEQFLKFKKMKLKTIKEVKKLKNKKILYRVDYNFTLEKKGRGWYAPVDHRRFTESLPTIKYLLKQGCSLVFLSWLKRPDGKVVEKYRMDPVARGLADLIGRSVIKIDNCVGKEVRQTIDRLKPGELLMLENVRFHAKEMKDDDKFAKDLTAGLDMIVFDAFSQSHRVHSSTTGILRHLPSCAGFLLEKEIKHLGQSVKNPKKPLTVILGGVKISDKLKALKFLSKKADHILIGGGLANIFLKARKVKVGDSYLEGVAVERGGKKINCVKEVKKFCQKNSNIILPLDMVAANKMNKKSKTKIIDLQNGEVINDGWMFLDIGPQTVKYYKQIIVLGKGFM